MFKLLIIFASLYCVHGYFTLPGTCPDKIKLKEDFRLSDFFDKWYQVYHYSSDNQDKNKCSTIELITKPTDIYLNQSRIDRGLFHRYSLGRLIIPTNIEDGSNLDVIFEFDDAPRRLKTRRYPFRVLATNYKYYATVYTCEYSPLVDKHFMYVWILSRHPSLNEVSKELALKPLRQLRIDSSQLVKHDFSSCHPKYYDDHQTEPQTFRYPVPI